MVCEPVEYAAAVDRYLAAAGLRQQSVRVYRIALATWAWALIGQTPPAGNGRRRAAPPLALLDAPDAPWRLRATLAARTATTEPRGRHMPGTSVRARGHNGGARTGAIGKPDMAPEKLVALDVNTGTPGLPAPTSLPAEVQTEISVGRIAGYGHP